MVNPENMQKNPKYKNVLLDIYDYFEKKINYLRSRGIKHNNIILDPGIGFGKNLKHNMTINEQYFYFSLTRISCNVRCFKKKIY